MEESKVLPKFWLEQKKLISSLAKFVAAMTKILFLAGKLANRSASTQF